MTQVSLSEAPLFETALLWNRQTFLSLAGLATFWFSLEVLELVLEKPGSSWAGLPSDRLVSAAHAVARWHRYAKSTGTARAGRDTGKDAEWLKAASLLVSRTAELQPSSLAAATCRIAPLVTCFPTVF